MNKPNWKDCPDGYNYLAQDKDGSWYWHKDKPEARCHGWWSKKYGQGKIASKNPDWRETLEKRPGKFAALEPGDYVITEMRKQLRVARVDPYIIHMVDMDGNAAGFNKDGDYCGDDNDWMDVKLSRKLAPNEVKFTLGSITGVIGKGVNPGWVKLYEHIRPGGYELQAEIRLSALPEQTRQLVEAVLFQIGIGE